MDALTPIDQLIEKLESSVNLETSSSDRNSVLDLRALETRLLLMQEGDKQKSGLHLRAALLFSKIYKKSGNRSDLDAAIENYESGIRISLSTGQKVSEDLHALGGLYSTRYEISQDSADLTQSIHHLTQSLHMQPSQSDQTLADISCIHWERYKALKDTSDLDLAISYSDTSIAFTPIESADRLERLENAAYLFLFRFQDGHCLKDIDRAIELGNDAVKLEHMDDEVKASSLRSLSTSYYERFNASKSKEDIDNAILNQTESVNLTPDDHPEKALRLHNLAEYFYLRFEHFEADSLGSDKTSDLDLSISYNLRAVADPDNLEDDSEKVEALRGLTSSLRARFSRESALQDLNDCIRYDSELIGLLCEDDPCKAIALYNAATSLIARFDMEGKTEDVNKAIACQSQAVRLTPDDHPKKWFRLNELAVNLSRRYARSGRGPDLDNAIAAIDKAITLVPDDHTIISELFARKGTLYRARFENFGQVEDLEKSLDNLTRSLEITTDGNEELPKRLSELGISLRTKYERLEHLEDLDKAIESTRRSISLTPVQSSFKLDRLESLAISLSSRFEAIRDIRDLNEAITLLKDVTESTEHSHFRKAYHYHNLALAYRHQFDFNGEISSLEDAIVYEKRSLDFTAIDDRQQPHRLFGLARSLSERYGRLLEIHDLEDALSTYELAIDLLPAIDSKMPTFLNSIALSYWEYYSHKRFKPDLEKAIVYQNRALALMPDDAVDKLALKANLGMMLRERFISRQDIQDINESIRLLSQVVAIQSQNNTGRASSMNNLSMSYTSRFIATQNLEDLSTAIQTVEDAISLTAADNTSLCTYLTNLTWILSVRLRSLNLPDDLPRVVKAASTSARLTVGPPYVRFAAALDWARHVRNDPNATPDSILEPYAVALGLLPRLSWLGMTIESRYNILIPASTLACDAVSAALKAGRSTSALQWLEQGRSIVWGQLLQLRKSVLALQAHRSDAELSQLADKLERTADDLQQASSLEERTLVDRTLDRIPLIQKRSRLASEWEDIVSRIRQKPGLQGFLLPKSFSELAQAARYGPVVVLNAGEYGCDALILANPDTLHHIPLSSGTYEKLVEAKDSLQELLDVQGLRVRNDDSDMERGFGPASRKDPFLVFSSILGDLWDIVVSPCLEYLESIFPPNPDELLHIRWCPTGPLAFLPVHAAGHYNEDGTATVSLLDRAVSSYTPTLGGLLEEVPEPELTRDWKSHELLAVIQPHTPGATRLPGTKAELEHIRRLTSAHKTPICVLEGSDGTIDEVLKAMKQCSIVHLACHGVQDIQRPLESGLLLHDGRLNLRRLLNTKFDNPSLAFLSACQTATGDATRPEEAIHLASGMLFAGYRNVIATMWSIRDNDAPFVAEQVYSELLKGDGPLTSWKVASALNKAVRMLRDRYKGRSFAAWVQFIHLGT